MFTYGETVTRLRAVPVIDPFSGELTGYDWSAPSSLALVAGIAPGAFREDVLTDRDTVDILFTVFVPFGSDIAARDRLVVRSRVCDVVGHPADWHHPMTGWEPGMVIEVREVEG